MLTARMIGTSVKRQMEAHLREAQDAARATVEDVGKAAQDLLRGQMRSAFGRGGDRLANAWRLRVFPRAGVRTLRPASTIMSKAPAIMDAFDRGATIKHRSGKYLAIPTGYNSRMGLKASNERRAEDGLPEARTLLRRVSVQDMIAARKQAFVIPSKKNPQVLLWCLKTRQTTGVTETGQRGRAQLRIGNRNLKVGTSKGQRALGELAKQGFVPMFYLVRQVRLRKKIDIAAVSRQASRMMISAMRAAYRSPAR